MGKWQTHRRHHKREPRGQPFPSRWPQSTYKQTPTKHSKHKTEQKHKRSIKTNLHQKGTIITHWSPLYDISDVIGLQAQFLLQFYSNLFGTLQLYCVWSEVMHVRFLTSTVSTYGLTTALIKHPPLNSVRGVCDIIHKTDYIYFWKFVYQYMIFLNLNFVCTLYVQALAIMDRVVKYWITQTVYNFWAKV